MKKIILLFLLSMAVLSCQEMTDQSGSAASPTFFYGNNGVVFPGDGILKPEFKGVDGKGTFSIYPAEGLPLNEETGEITLTEKTPAYRYLIRFVSADGKYMLQTMVSVAGVRYPARFYDISIAEDTMCRPIWDTVHRQSIKPNDFKIDGAELEIYTPDTKEKQGYKAFVPTNTEGIVAAIKKNAINPENGDLNLNAMVSNVYGVHSNVGGKVKLSISYLLNGKPTYTTYVIYRENIKNPAYRKMLRDWLNMDMVLISKQKELMEEKKVGPIRVHQRWGNSLGSVPSYSNSVFRFTSALQSFPPPESRAIVEGEDDE